VKEIKIYLVSFFLSPLGFLWFFKYFRSAELKDRKIAYISLILTLIPLVLMLVIGNKLVSLSSGIMEEYKKNLDAYSELGL